MEFSIKRAVLNDLDQVIELASESIIHSISPIRVKADAEKIKVNRRLDLSLFKKNFRNFPYAVIFIAQKDDTELAGYIFVATGAIDMYSLEKQSFGFDISVKPKYQGHGIASILFKKAEEFTKKKDCCYIAVEVTSSNKKVIAHSKKVGLEVERLMMTKTINERQMKESIKSACLNLPDIKIKHITAITSQQLKEITELYTEELVPVWRHPLREVDLTDLKQRQVRVIQERIISFLATQKFQLLAAEDKDGKIAGFAFYARNSLSDISMEKQGNFLDLAVRNDYKGTGLAYLLHFKSEEDIWSVKDNYYITNYITITNKRALAFAKKLGYQEERKYMIKKLF